MIPIRFNERPKLASRVFDLAPTHPLVNELCPACEEACGPDLVVLVPVGPGRSPKNIEAAREGRWHSTITVAVHVTCSGYTADEIKAMAP